MEAGTEAPDPKRRKTRKGTRSCWECKRRKIRCIYATSEDAICIGCARRCTDCVTQEYPERRTSPITQGRLMGDRIERMEVRIAQLAKQATSEQLDSRMSPSSLVQSIAHDIPTPKSTISATILRALSPSNPVEISRPENHNEVLLAENSSHQRVSRLLLATFPSADDLHIIAEASGNVPYYFLQPLTKPHGHFRSFELEKFGELIGRDLCHAHPVIIAQHMFMITMVIMHTDPSLLRGLSESPHNMIKRLADTAIDLVASNDRMMGTVEGIECLIFQAAYEEHMGNLQHCWLALRHAIAIAQVMGLHRQIPPPVQSIRANATVDTHYLWYRLLYHDRSMSLMNGLPQAVSETLPISEYVTKFGEPLDELDYIHALVASRILKRNERGPGSDDMIQTQELDMELQRGATKFPSRWWLVPDLTSTQDEAQIFWEVAKLRCQTNHYSLLIQLHLPLMLHLSFESDSRRHGYSRSTCVNASRDLLHRYIKCRAFSTTKNCCMVIDFYAFWSAMALLFAHISGHRTANQAENILGHQRLSDRGTVEQTLEIMRRPSHGNDDLFKTKTIKFLEKMLAIEDDASRGLRLRFVMGEEAMSNTNILRISIPYVGVIAISEDSAANNKIAPHHEELFVSRDTSQQEIRLSTEMASGPSSGRGARPDQSLHDQREKHIQYASPASTRQISKDQGPGEIEQENLISPVPLAQAAESSQCFSRVFGDTGFNGSVQPLDLDPTGGSDQWAFQDIELDFFDSLMREADQFTSNGYVDWLPWPAS